MSTSTIRIIENNDIIRGRYTAKMQNFRDTLFGKIEYTPPWLNYAIKRVETLPFDEQFNLVMYNTNALYVVDPPIDRVNIYAVHRKQTNRIADYVHVDYFYMLANKYGPHVYLIEHCANNEIGWALAGCRIRFTTQNSRFHKVVTHIRDAFIHKYLRQATVKMHKVPVGTMLTTLNRSKLNELRTLVNDRKTISFDTLVQGNLLVIKNNDIVGTPVQIPYDKVSANKILYSNQQQFVIKHDNANMRTHSNYIIVTAPYSKKFNAVKSPTLTVTVFSSPAKRLLYTDSSTVKVTGDKIVVKVKISPKNNLKQNYLRSMILVDDMLLINI